MSTSVVHIDLTELVRKPLRSGIQRVERQALCHWAGSTRPVPCIFDERGRLLRLSPAVLDVLCGEVGGSPEAQDKERRALATFAAAGEPIADAMVSRLLNLELFFDPVRAEAHLRLAQAGVRVMWYLYDFIPFLRPELFPPGASRICMHFLRGLRAPGDRLAFLSTRTREDYVTRIGRRPPPSGGWPVLDPGADGLGLEAQAFSVERRDFVSIGTIEPRKNTEALLRAFEALWQRGIHARLVLAGRVSPDAAEAIAFLERHAANPQFRFLKHPSDAALRDVLRGARAVIMPSENEGFGLPPYEALYAGIPAVASASLPSAALMPRGALLLPRMNSETIADAVATLLDDGAAARLWSQAGALELPRWSDFGRRLSAWAETA